jgi:UDP-N-acetyl-D-mannosaminuronate dehydrogenase
MLPKLEEKGYKVGKDVFLAFSPERVDPEMRPIILLIHRRSLVE